MRTFLAGLCAITLLSGCAAAVIGGTAATVGTSAAQERGLGGRSVDARIQTTINKQWLGQGLTFYNALDMKVFRRRVLVMGCAANPEKRELAAQIASRVAGVRDVINEVQVCRGKSLWSTAKDVRIAAELDSRITFADGVKNLNYTTNVLGGVVYLMGIAQTDQELATVIGIARAISGVREVKSYVEFGGRL